MAALRTMISGGFASLALGAALTMAPLNAEARNRDRNVGVVAGVIGAIAAGALIAGAARSHARPADGYGYDAQDGGYPVQAQYYYGRPQPRPYYQPPGGYDHNSASPQGPGYVPAPPPAYDPYAGGGYGRGYRYRQPGYGYRQPVCTWRNRQVWNGYAYVWQPQQICR